LTNTSHAAAISYHPAAPLVSTPEAFAHPNAAYGQPTATFGQPTVTFAHPTAFTFPTDGGTYQPADPDSGISMFAYASIVIGLVLTAMIIYSIIKCCRKVRHNKIFKGRQDMPLLDVGMQGEGNDETIALTPISLV
jgi:hypothetical protein